MVVGDVDLVAFEVEKYSDEEGKVFIHILGRKYGNDKFSYELLDLCKGFEWEVTVRREYPSLLKLSSEEILEFRECVLAGFEEPECESYKSLGVPEDAISDIFFYSPIYMLDAYGVALVQGFGKEKLHFYDEGSGSVSLMLDQGFFYGLIIELVKCIRSGN